MKRSGELIYSYWNADTNPLEERVSQALRVVDKLVPQTTYWNAGPSHPTGPDDKFQFPASWDPAVRDTYGGPPSTFWEQTVSHFSAEGKDPNDLIVNSSAYAADIDLAVRVYFDDQKFIVDCDIGEEDEYIDRYEGQLIELLKGLGSCPSLCGSWMRKHSAFAGDPVCLYEPNKPFAKLYDALDYRKVTEEVRRIRKSVREILDPNSLELILKKMNIHATSLGSGRIFVRLGDPKSKGGTDALKELNQEIASMLKKT